MMRFGPYENRHCEHREAVYSSWIASALMRFAMTMILMGSTQALSYAFLCNGVDANGSRDSDSCTQSCISAPTKWSNNATSYNIDTSVLFPGISASEWTSNIVIQSFSDWSSVPDVNLSLASSVSSVRSFGTNTASHDVFWVTSSTEWADKVGEPADTGILAVTLPIYNCPTSGKNFREIFDADMIVNGVASADYPWKPTCSSLSFSCQSVLATVAHESGHFLGLGHPDTESPNLMSAIAAYLVQYPQLDDMQGIRTLYPDGSAGAYTTICSDTQSCASGLSCHTQGSVRYCSKTCQTASDCQNHLLCSGGFCEFPNAQQLGGVGLHQDCSANPCESGLLCVAVSSGKEYCFTDCTNNSSACLSPETCRQLRSSSGNTIAAKACIAIKQEGQSCAGATSCDHNQNLTCSSNNICVSNNCVPQSGGSTGEFDASTQTGCSTGGSGGSAKTGCSAGGDASQWTWLLCLLPWITVPRRKKKC